MWRGIMNIDKITSRFGFTFKRDVPWYKWIEFAIRNIIVLILVIIWLLIMVLYFPIKVFSNLLDAIFQLISLRGIQEAKYRLTEF